VSVSLQTNILLVNWKLNLDPRHLENRINTAWGKLEGGAPGSYVYAKTQVELSPSSL